MLENDFDWLVQTEYIADTLDVPPHLQSTGDVLGAQGGRTTTQPEVKRGRICVAQPVQEPERRQLGKDLSSGVVVRRRATFWEGHALPKAVWPFLKRAPLDRRKYSLR